jgi:cytochrome c-type biogenesis protein
MITGLNILSIFFAGILSFLSPCVIGVLPLYFSYIAETTFSELQATGSKTKLIMKTLVLISGFSLFFVLLGAAASGIGSFLFANKTIVNISIGILLIIFGLITMDILNPKFLHKQFNFKFNISNSYFTAFLLGIAFAFVLGPCATPLLGTALTLAANTDTIYQGMFYLFIYSLGVGVPFLITAFFAEKAIPLFRNNMAKFVIIKKIAGFIILALGIYILATGSLSFYF